MLLTSLLMGASVGMYQWTTIWYPTRLANLKQPPLSFLSRVNAGSVYWNCCDRVSPRLPWSGHGDSGVGLTLSTMGIQTFTRPRAWHLRQP